MRAIRRLYFYAVAFISLEVVLWGLIGLARATFSSSTVGGVDQLAQALALILVGVPVFGVHWWAAQRSAHQDEDEHASGVRTVFLYAVLLALLIPVVQNGLAFLDRLLLDAFGLSASRAVLGGSQTSGDNLLAAVMNGILAAYFVYVLRDDWATIPQKGTLGAVRRLYRYIWVVYSLLMAVGGVQQMLRYLLSLPAAALSDFGDYAWFVNGLALILVGVPLWVAAWKTVQDSLVEAEERASLLRLGVLYVLSLSGVVFVLSAAGVVIDALLRMILDEFGTFRALMREISGPLSMGIPLGGVWAYYGHWLKRDMDAAPDAPRRAGMRRLYYYILSAIGLAATFIGVTMLLSFTIDAALGQGVWGGSLRDRLAASLATLLAGLPLWLLTWRPMQAEALTLGDAGDHARRSIVRKVYLYFVLFSGVVGGMVAAVRLAFLLFSTLLGARPEGFTNEFLDVLQVLALFTGLLAYHWQVLRRDGAQATQALANKHALFPVMVFDPGDGTFAREVAAALEKQAPRLALTVQRIGETIPDEARARVKTVILPGNLAVEPPEALRLWLRDFNGSRLIVPFETPGWLWTGDIRQAAQAVRQLAEGEDVRLAAKSSGWMIAVYLLAGLAGLEIVFILLALVISAF